MRDRPGGKRPTLSVARKLVRRCHRTLRELGDRAWVPVALSTPDGRPGGCDDHGGLNRP